jgi:hypothetical protein
MFSVDQSGKKRKLKKVVDFEIQSSEKKTPLSRFHYFFKFSLNFIKEKTFSLKLKKA